MCVKMLFAICILLLVGEINAYSSKRSHEKAEDLIADICETLFDENINSKDDHRWEKLCQHLIKAKITQQKNDLQDENVIDDLYDKQSYQPRLLGSRSRSGSRSRGSTGGSGGSRLPIPSIRYRSRRTGAIINRPTGSLWSRARHSFLPVSRHYFSRSRSSGYNRYTTPSTGGGTFYYCTSNSTNSSEIQCATSDGDNQCCDDELGLNVFCCGGKTSDDLDEDFNQAKRLLARMLCTLSAVAFAMHMFIRRFRP